MAKQNPRFQAQEGSRGGWALGLGNTAIVDMVRVSFVGCAGGGAQEAVEDAVDAVEEAVEDVVEEAEEEMVVCPVCGAKFPKGTETCPICGASLL